MEKPQFVATLALPTKDGVISLGERKTGRWVGVLNGPGGKQEENETAVACIIREIEEEFGMRLSEERVGEPVALVNFHAAGVLHFQVHVFLVDGFEGVPVETESMRPEAHPLDAIPYHRMMEGDRHWFPHVLRATRTSRLKITVRYREAGVGLLEEPTVEPWL